MALSSIASANGFLLPQHPDDLLFREPTSPHGPSFPVDGLYPFLGGSDDLKHRADFPSERLLLFVGTTPFVALAAEHMEVATS
jgi:hypothetical protein